MEREKKPIVVRGIQPKDEVMLDLWERKQPIRVIAAAVGWTPQAAHRHIRRLRAAGHPRAVRRG